MKEYNDKLFYKVVKPPIKLLVKLLYRPKIVGLENIPKEGRVILAGNHTKWLDPVCLVAMTKRPIHFLAKKELFDGKARLIVKGMGCISVNRKTHDKNSLKEAYKYLENEKCIGIFPEGTINRTDDIIMPFKIGAIKAASETNSPIVPFIITGEYKLFKKTAKIEFLEPIQVGNNLDEENIRLMNIVKEKLIEGGKNERTRQNDNI